eukprot:Skav220169  [mRNA]  locus=scaffold564:397008:397838:+ [translate_table: standard]
MASRNFLAEQECPYSIKVFSVAAEFLFEVPQNKGWNAVERIIKVISRGQHCTAHPPQCVSLVARHSTTFLTGDIPEEVMRPYNEYCTTEVRHLHGAIGLGMLTEVKLALNSRTNPNLSYGGNAPLAVAILDRHREEDESTELLVETLLEAKALPQTDDEPNQDNLLHLTVRSSLCEYESTSILHMLCEAPLHTAAYYGHSELVRSLLALSADVNFRAPLLKYTRVSTYEDEKQRWYGHETALHHARCCKVLAAAVGLMSLWARFRFLLRLAQKVLS